MEEMVKQIISNPATMTAVAAGLTSIGLKEPAAKLLNPSFEQIGIFAGRVCSIPNLALDVGKVLVEQSYHKVDDIMRRANKKLDEKPSEHIPKITPDLLLSLIRNAQFIMDEEELKEMYANLLVSACNSEYIPVSYSFVLIQMTQIEALIIEIVSRKKIITLDEDVTDELEFAALLQNKIPKLQQFEPINVFTAFTNLTGHNIFRTYKNNNQGVTSFELSYIGKDFVSRLMGY